MELENIKAHYINLDFRKDRDKDIKEKLTFLGFNQQNIYRFSAIDGKNLSQDLNKKDLMNTHIVKLVKNKNILYKNCELACLLSHYFLLQHIIQNPNINDNELIFIFEDDFFINKKYIETKPFTEIIEEIKCFTTSNEWEIIFLGGRFKEGFIPTSFTSDNELFKKINENFYLRVKGKGYNWDRTTHNYIVNKKSAEKLCKIIENNFKSTKLIKVIDKLLCDVFNGLKSYDYFPHIFYSPNNYTSDIQFSKLTIQTGNI